MMWNHDTSLGAWLWPSIGLLVALGIGLVAAIVARGRAGRPRDDGATRILQTRLARGEIDEAEYRERLATLRGSSWGTRSRPRWISAPVLGLAVALALTAAAAASALVIRDGSGLVGPGPGGVRASCAAPSLPGRIVDVTLGDMGGVMGRQGMMGSPSGWSMMGPGGLGRMWISVRPSTVMAPDGRVSFRVWNAGRIVHELVVLPLSSGSIGQRAVGPEGTISEAGSLGEASATCAGGEGEGISPGALGWVTLHLAPGRYELVCNLPGHYAAGMFAELDVR